MTSALCSGTAATRAALDESLLDLGDALVEGVSSDRLVVASATATIWADQLLSELENGCD